MKIEEKYASKHAKPKVNSHNRFDFGVGVEETDDDSFPSLGGRKVEEKEDEYLYDESEEENGIGELKHEYLNIISHIMNSDSSYKFWFYNKYVVTTAMADLTPEQYESVLKYMETTNE